MGRRRELEAVGRRRGRSQRFGGGVGSFGVLDRKLRGGKGMRGEK